MMDDAANEALDALSACQCCLLGGQQRSLKTMYSHLGKPEIYSDMLKECFDIRLSVGSEKSGICEVCVERLRVASNFKLQVQRSQAELRTRLKRALGILEEEPATAKQETDEAKTSNILLDDESAVELFDDDGASPVMCEGQVKSEEPDEDATREPPGPPEELAASIKSEIDEDDDGTNGNMSESSDDSHSIKSEKPDDDATSDEDLTPACSPSARARQQLAMTCSVILEHLCHICHVTFEQESSLATHMVEHDDSQIQTDTYKCDVCKQQFTLRGDLERHIGTHASEKPFKCEICYKSFSCRKYWRRHVLIHNAQKPFQCKICHKSFSWRCALKRHVIIHTGDKPYSCDMCNRQFTDKSNLRKHVSFTLHAFKCDICNKQFARKEELITHVNIHTGQMPVECHAAPVTPAPQLFKNKQIMTLPSQYIYYITKYVRSNIELFPPMTSNSIRLTNRNKNKLATPYPPLAKASKTMSIVGPRIYNKVPDQIKEIESDITFLYKLKKWLMSRAFSSLEEFYNCDIQ